MEKIIQKLDKALRGYSSEKLLCRSCGQNISVTAHSCPHCGDIDPFLFVEFSDKCYNIHKKMRWAIIIALFVIIALFHIHWIVGIISIFVICGGLYAIFEWHKKNEIEEFIAFALHPNCKFSNSYPSIKKHTEYKEQWKNILYSIAESIIK
jgi:hypothetical protein